MSGSVRVMGTRGQPDGIQGFAAGIDRVVVLRDGASVHLRPIRPDDAPRLVALCRRLGPRPGYQRFFSPRRLRPEGAPPLANLDYPAPSALVAEAGTGPAPRLVPVSL